ncbi:MAG: lysophospholipid acyltransferase family protein [Porticoccaceae bacterium]
MRSALALSLLKIISLLPLGLARFFGYIMGVIMTIFATAGYKTSQQNIAHCFPDKPSQANKALAKARMSHLGQAFFETPGLWRRSSDWLQSKIIAVEGESYLNEAIASNRGTILLIPHQGNWEVIGLWVAKQTAMTSLYQPPKNSQLGHWIKKSRERTGANLVPTNVRGVAALLKALGRGETVAILPDQQPPKASGDFAPLFEKPALTMTLAYNLLNRSGSQALFCCALREQGGWRLKFMPADQAIYSEDQAISLKAMNQGVEAIAAEAFDQYQWEYKRYRTQPEGYPSIYLSGS